LRDNFKPRFASQLYNRSWPWDESWKITYLNELVVRKVIGCIYFTKKWWAETVQPGLWFWHSQTPDFKRSLQMPLLAERFHVCDWIKEGAKIYGTLPMSFLTPQIFPVFTSIIVYGFWYSLYLTGHTPWLFFAAYTMISNQRGSLTKKKDPCEDPSQERRILEVKKDPCEDPRKNPCCVWQ
jgi:hypothetical protein